MDEVRVIATPDGHPDDVIEIWIYSVAHGRTVKVMTAMTTRPYEPRDAAAVTTLMNVIDEVGGGRAGMTVEATGAMLGSQVACFSTDTRLTFAADGALIAAGTVATPPTGGFRVDLSGGVHPDWRGQGLGRAVLGWQYERAAQIHAATAPQQQWQAEIGVMAGEPTAARLFARLEFAVVRYFFEMLAPTASTRHAPLPAGLRSEMPTPSLDRPIFDAHVEAFADHWGAQRREFDKWLPLALHSKDFQPALSRVAFDNDEIAGYVLTYRDNDPTRGYIGHVGTRRAWRGKGVASALMAEVIEAAGQAGYSSVCLGVDADSPTGAVRVYERAGFKQEHTFVAYRRPIGR